MYKEIISLIEKNFKKEFNLFLKSKYDDKNYKVIKKFKLLQNFKYRNIN